MIFRLGLLDSIADTLSSIGQFFKDIGDFVVTWFRDMVSAVKLLRESVDLLTNSCSPINLFPAAIVTIFGTIIVIVILYKVLGREG